MSLGYDLGLLSMGGLTDWSDDELLKRAEEVGKIIRCLASICSLRSEVGSSASIFGAVLPISRA